MLEIFSFRLRSESTLERVSSPRFAGEEGKLKFGV